MRATVTEWKQIDNLFIDATIDLDGETYSARCKFATIFKKEDDEKRLPTSARVVAYRHILDRHKFTDLIEAKIEVNESDFPQLVRYVGIFRKNKEVKNNG